MRNILLYVLVSFTQLTLVLAWKITMRLENVLFIVFKNSNDKT